MTDEALKEPSRDSAGTGDTLRVGRQWWSSKRAFIQQGVSLWLLAVGRGLHFNLQLFNLKYTPVAWQQRRSEPCWGNILGQISQLLQLGSLLKRDKCKWKRGQEKGALAWMKQAAQHRHEGRKWRNNSNFVEEIFGCWKTTGRNKSPKWDGTYFVVVWWSSVADCLGREGGVWAFNSYFLSSWGTFIHLEGRHHDTEQNQEAEIFKVFFCVSSYRQSPFLGPLVLIIWLGKREVDDFWGTKVSGDYLEQLSVFRSVELNRIHLEVYWRSLLKWWWD